VLARPGDKQLEVTGKWRIESDPEFGVFERLDVETVNSRPAALTVSFWLGALRLEDQNGTKIAVFIRLRPEGEDQGAAEQQ
jgi:hypothetical protein